jgi:hypothetical protein
MLLGYQILTKCPVCNSKLTVSKLTCKNCNTVIENDFELSKFSYLSKEQLNFAEIFIKCRGNIKDVEKELKISYPTVRAKIEDLVAALGYKQVADKSPDTKEIMDKLESGEISTEEAIKLIKNN